MIIAFCGDIGAGKDTACNGLRLLNYKQLAFADPLRQVAATVFGLSQAEMIDRTLKEQPLNRWPFMSPRAILQKVGTECFRDQFPGVWIEALLRHITPGEKVCISDCRFVDEAAAIQEIGGILVRIDNPNVTPSVDAHRSQADWKHFDYDDVIVNDSDSPHAFGFKVMQWLQDYSKIRDQ
jgi:hypothetical protein